MSTTTTADALAAAVAAVQRLMAESRTIDFVGWRESGVLADGYHWKAQGPSATTAGVTVTVFGPDSEELDSVEVPEPEVSPREVNWHLFDDSEGDREVSATATEAVREVLGDRFSVRVTRRAFHDGVVLAVGETRFDGRVIHTMTHCDCARVSSTGVADVAKWRAVGIYAAEELVEDLRRWAQSMYANASALVELIEPRDSRSGRW